MCGYWLNEGYYQVDGRPRHRNDNHCLNVKTRGVPEKS